MKKQDNISESRSFTSCAPHHRAEDMGNHQWISAFLCGGHRFNQVASGGKYLDLPMESSSAPPFPVVAWGWSGPQGKWITQRGHMPDLVTKKERKKSFSFVIFFFFFVPFHWREILAISSGQGPMRWLSAFAPLCLFKRMLFGLVFVCCWCLVPERGSDLYKLISPSADPRGNQARSRDLLGGVSALCWPTSTLLSPPLQKQCPRLCRILLEPGWEVGWETSSLEKAVHHNGLWYQVWNTREEWK